MRFVTDQIRRLRGRDRDGVDRAPSRYGSHWVPVDETEAMDQILNVSDRDTFEAAGRHDAEQVLGPFIRPTDTVLDLGCGIGRVTRYVAPLCREVWGVDVSDTMLGYARARLGNLPNVRLVRGDGPSLPSEIPTGGIDFAYSLLTLQHVEREHAFMLLRDLRRVLRNGGVAYLTFPNLLSDRYLADFVQYAETGEAGNIARARFYTPQEVDRILPAAGFAIREMRPDVEIHVVCDTA